MEILVLSIFISMLIYIFKFVFKFFLCKKIKIEATVEIENDLKKVRLKFKKNIGLAIIYILLLIAFIAVTYYYCRVSGNIIKFIVTLIAASVILGPVYNLLKTIPDISDILVQNYGFVKKDKENFFYRNEVSGEKIFFNYYVGDTYDLNKKFTHKLSYRYVNTEFRYYLNAKSNEKSTNINMHIREFIDRYNSSYIPKYLRVEKCIYDVNKNFLIITIKNNCLLYSLYNNKTIAKLLILSLKESEKIISEIIRNCIYL